MIFTAEQLAQVLNGTIEGDPMAEAGSFARIENGKKGNLCFFANPKYEQYVYSSHPSILLVDKSFQPKEEVTATMIRVDNAYAAITDLLAYVAGQRKAYRCRRSLLRSRIALSARLGRKVWVGDFVTIGKKSTIGECTRICDNVTIGEGCRIGHHCLIHPGVRIYDNTVIGDRCILHENCVVGSDGFGNAPRSDGSWKKIEHLGNVIIGNDVEIGACATIDRAEMESTVIEDGCRIDNLCMVAHNVRVGRNTAMAAQSGIAGSAQIGEGCIMAGQSGVVGHIKVAPHTTIAAKTGIIGNVRTPGQTYLGMPGILHKNFMRSYAIFKKAGEEQ